VGYLAALAVFAAGAWSLTVTTATPTAGATELAVPGGAVHLGPVHAAAEARHGMPGMGTDNDPVPAGKRRVTIDVTLVASDDADLEYSVDRFDLAVDGAHLRPHRAVLPGYLVPAGTRLSGSLVFDVPDAARTGVLRFAGGDGTVVRLPAENEHSGHRP
jgi:hypothetical protein